MDLRFRWGSCTEAHLLNFHWKMIPTPMGIIEYVVVHQMAQLIEKNYTPEFWHVVGLILPDYKDLKILLDKNGKELDK
jgi:predicted metal-dependent hydrolase